MWFRAAEIPAGEKIFIRPTKGSAVIGVMASTPPLMKALDEINGKYGRDTVRFSVARPGRRWEMRFMRRSRRYTTCLGEVLRVA
ncbi:MAG: DUF4113 domain-containing protein [Acidobacteria bacterium]|nr:DUF4113 domain-containing protein [Acidobacteriota bacterium]